MDKARLVQEIRQKKSFLCVGLDLDLDKMPAHLRNTAAGWLQFNKSIIDCTKDLCVAYKPNWAFYEALGIDGMKVLKDTIAYIGKDHLVIADAKRGDIGNTSKKYSQAIFQEYKADAITVAPYMGMDSVEPFLVNGKWVIILALTSNQGSSDFQKLTLANGRPLYQEVLGKYAQGLPEDQTMFVVGATHPQMLADIRKIIPDHFLLVPGVGAQGGSLAEVCENGLNSEVGLLINSSRSIIYAGGHEVQYAEHVRESALLLQQKMSTYL